MQSIDSECGITVVTRDPKQLPSYLAALRQSESNPHSSASLRRAVDLLALDSVREENEDAPFLTVVLRTQGRRPETLKDSLLCLVGQTSEDFEVIVACHEASDEHMTLVEGIVGSQPRSLRERTRVLRVSGGRRARPLNEAVAVARGRYLAFYDDDDLVFGNWVEAFATAAAAAPGKLVRAVVASQHARAEFWPQDQTGFRHVTWPAAEYPTRFNQLAHFRMNFSPFMGWAFPRQLFFTLGEVFDEELYVCEDWDLILRGSLLCGVVEAEQLTAIYRRWDGVDSSYTTHDRVQWEASQARVIAKLDERLVPMPEGSVTQIRALLQDRDELIALRDHYHALIRSRGYRYAAPIREAMRAADFARRVARRVVRRLR